MGSAPHPSPELGGPLIAVPLRPDPSSLGLGLLFSLDEGGAIGLFQILHIGLCHAGGDHFLVHIPLLQPEDGDHPPVVVDIEDLHPDGSLNRIAFSVAIVCSLNSGDRLATAPALHRDQ